MKAREYLPVAENRGAPRIWIEGLGRLDTFGFQKNDRIVATQNGNNLCLTKAQPHQSANLTVVSRRGKNILDINSDRWLGRLKQFPEARADFHIGKIMVRPTIQAFYIHKGLQPKKTLEALEIFAGGGLFATALKNAGIHSRMAIEIERKYAELYHKAHPETEVIRADIRKMTSGDFPYTDIIVAGIPCTSHSNMGRAKNNLAGKPETGEQGDLFLPVIHLIASKMPRAVVLENVPCYANSLAGALVRTHLSKIGYHVFETILNPNAEWADIQDRKRWCLVATLSPGFEIESPNTPNQTKVSTFLDPAGPQDIKDVLRIEKTIKGLHKHFAAQKTKGNGFAMTTLTGEETKIPTIPRSYHKINQGPFVETPHGLRMLRQAELERIFCHQVPTDSYSTAVQIMGQGISVGPFTEVFKQLKEFLTKTPEHIETENSIQDTLQKEFF